MIFGACHSRDAVCRANLVFVVAVLFNRKDNFPTCNRVPWHRKANGKCSGSV